MLEVHTMKEGGVGRLGGKFWGLGDASKVNKWGIGKGEKVSIR